MAVQIQLRRGTASQWTTSNPILAQGEFGLEYDTNKFKIGNGINNWNDLGYGNNLTGIGDIPGVDSTSTLSPPDGSLLVYSTATTKWTASLDLVKQNLDGGFY